MVQLVELITHPVQVNPRREVSLQVQQSPRQRAHHRVVISECLLKKVLKTKTGHMSVEEGTLMSSAAAHRSDYRKLFGSLRAGGGN